MPITAQLQRFVDDELSRSTALADELVRLTLAQIQPREGSAAEREQAHDLAQKLRQQSAPFVKTFVESLRSAVQADLQGAPAGAATVPPAQRGLELVDETRVEVDIEVAGVAHAILAAAEWELRELQTFTSTLAGQQHVSADTNPLQPQPYARALWNAAAQLCPPGPQRTLLLRHASAVLANQLKTAWAAACTRLETQGVEPGIYRTIVLAPGPKVDRAPSFDITKPGMLEELLPRMLSGAAAGAGPRARQRQSQSLNPSFDEALTRLEGLLEQASAKRASGVASPRLAEHRDTLMASTLETVDRQIVELLSRLFEAVLADARLPPAFRAVMARLQVSALRVALADPTMLETHDHPVWRLINRIGSSAETYARTADPRWIALLAYCEKLAEDIARAPVQDDLLYKLSLSRLDAFLAEQLREQQQRVQPSIDALTHAEQRDELEPQVAERLHEQLLNVRVTTGVRRFICGLWAKALAESILRHGEKGEVTAEYLRATDDLLWSLKLPDHPQSRKRLLAVLPGLLQKLRAGMTMAGVPESDQELALDELMTLHAEALRPGSKPPAPQPEDELSAEQIVQRMREETEWAPSSRPPFSDSLIDLASMETVPAELLHESVSTHDEAVQRIETLPIGSRHHLFLQGRWTRVQLLWRSPHGRFFLFAGPDPAHAHSMTRRALERLSEEGLFKPLDDVSLVQRAVDSLVHKLAQPA